MRWFILQENLGASPEIPSHLKEGLSLGDSIEQVLLKEATVDQLKLCLLDHHPQDVILLWKPPAPEGVLESLSGLPSAYRTLLDSLFPNGGEPQLNFFIFSPPISKRTFRDYWNAFSPQDFFFYPFDWEEIRYKIQIFSKINFKESRGLQSVETSHQKLKDQVSLQEKKLQDLRVTSLNKQKRLESHIKHLDLISQTRSLEELARLLWKLTKPFHNLKKQYLAYKDQWDSLRFLEISENPTDISISTPKFTDPPGLEPSKDKVQKIPIPTLSSSQTNPFHWEIHHHFSSEEKLNFDQWISEIKDLLGLVLDRLISEEHIRQETLLWEKVFQQIQNPLAIVDSHRRIVRVNHGKKIIEEYCARNPYLHRPPLPLPQFFSYEDRTYSVMIFPITYSPHLPDSHQLLHFEDITEQNLLRLRWLQSEKMGVLGDLAQNIGSEFQRPLKEIKYLTQNIIQEWGPQLDPKHLTDIRDIEKACTRSQGIIENLLNFAGGKALIPEATHVNSLIRNTLPLLKTALRGQQIHMDLGENADREIVLQPSLFQQVVFNLILNASQTQGTEIWLRTGVKSTDSTSAPPSQEVQMTPKNGLNLEFFFSVEDNGEGISENLRSQIFEPFFTTKPPGEGSGLGLSLSKTIMERLGGRLEFTPTDKGGSCFTVTLPLESLSCKTKA